MVWSPEGPFNVLENITLGEKKSMSVWFYQQIKVIYTLKKCLLHYFNFTPSSQVQKEIIKRKDNTVQPRFFTVPPRALSANAQCILCPWAESNSQHCLWGWGGSLPPRREQVFLMDPTSLWMSATSPLALPNRLWTPREENKCHKNVSLLFMLRAL